MLILWEKSMDVINFYDDLYTFDDNWVREFLLIGDKEAILIDTGFKEDQIMEEIRKVTDLPLKILLTHGDPDHTGGLIKGNRAYLCPKDRHLIHDDIDLIPLEEGDLFECGEYSLKVIEIPGHTFGSVAFFDQSHGILFSGDSVQEPGPIFMFGDHRNLDQYIESQRKLLNLSCVKTILPSHHNYPLRAEVIAHNLADAIALKDGSLPFSKHPDLPCNHYIGQWTEFYF